jgi:hypothetical protein
MIHHYAARGRHIEAAWAFINPAPDDVTMFPENM